MTTAIQNAQSFANAALGKSQSLFSAYTPGGTITLNPSSLVAGVSGINATAVQRTVGGNLSSSYNFPAHLITPSVVVIAQHTSGTYPIIGDPGYVSPTTNGFLSDDGLSIKTGTVTGRWNSPTRDICLLKFSAPLTGVTPYKLIQDDYAGKIGNGSGMPLFFVNPNLQVGINQIKAFSNAVSSTEITVVSQQDSPWVSDSLLSVANQSSGPMFTVINNTAVLLAAIHTGTASPPPNEPAGPLLLSGQLQDIITNTFGLSETISTIDLSSFSSVSMSYSFSATKTVWDTGVGVHTPYPLGFDANRGILCTFNNTTNTFQSILRPSGVRVDVGNPAGLSPIYALGSHPVGVLVNNGGNDGFMMVVDMSTGDILNSEQFVWQINDSDWVNDTDPAAFTRLIAYDVGSDKIIVNKATGNLIYKMSLPPSNFGADHPLDPDNTNGLPTPHSTPNDLYGGGFPWNGGWLVARRLNNDGSRAIGTLAFLSLDRSTELATYTVAGITDTIGAVMTDGTGIFGVSDNDNSGNATINFYIITAAISPQNGGTVPWMLFNLF